MAISLIGTPSGKFFVSIHNHTNLSESEKLVYLQDTSTGDLLSKLYPD